MTAPQENRPTLRFTEFSGEWKQYSVSQLFKITAGGDIDNKNVSLVMTGEFKYPIYANAEKNKGFYGYSDLYKVEKGAITIAGRGVNIGIVHARNHEFYPIVRLLVLIPKDDVSIFFYEYALNRLNIVPESTGVPQLTAPQISNYKLYTTTLPEQQKIAAFLTSVDDKIQQLTQKKNLLEQYKKGMMQKLFSRELRFKDDNDKDFPEWEEKRLGNISTKKSSNIAANTIEDNFGEYPIYGATGLLQKVDFFREERDYISIVKDGAGAGRVLICKGKSSVLGTLDIINANLNIDLYFLYTCLQRIQFEKYIVGSTIPHIYYKDYSNEIVEVPTYNEQYKIGAFLSNIDNKISEVQTQIEQTKLYKKGLLQQMFV